MEDWVIAVVVILALLMVGISGLVGYLLYRPGQRKKKPKKGSMTPDGEVATKYPEPPENGDVKLTMPEDGNGTMLPPYSPAKKGSLSDEPKDVKVDIESDSDKDQPEKKGLLKEVKVEPQERAVDVGQLEQKAPEGPISGSSTSLSDDGKGKVKDGSDSDKKPTRKTSSSSSSSGSDGDKVLPVVVAGDKDKPDSAKEKNAKMPGASSSSSSSSSDDDGTVEPMAPLEPRIIRDEQPKDKESDDSDLVSDVLAVVDQPKEKKGSSSSLSDDDKKDKILVAPVAARKRSPKDKRGSESSTSSSDEFDPNADARKKPPKPRQRTRKPSDGKKKRKPSRSSTTSDDSTKVIPIVAAGVQGEKKPSSSTSSGSDDGAKKIKVQPVVAGAKHPAESTSSSSSSDGEGEKLVPVAVPRDKSPKAKRKTSASSTSSSDGDNKVVPVIVGKEGDAKMKGKPSSSSSSSDGGKKKITPVAAAKDKKPKDGHKSSSSSSSSDSEKKIIPVVAGKDKDAKKPSSSSSSSETDEETRKRRSELIVVKPKRHPGEGSSSSSSSDDGEKMIVPVVAAGEKQSKKKSTSSSSSDSDDEARRRGDDISTQTADIPTRKRSKQKKKTRSTPPTKVRSPIATQTSKISSSSSSESDDEASKIKRIKKRSSATSSSSSSSEDSVKRKQTELHVTPVKVDDLKAKKAPEKESSSSSSDEGGLTVKGKPIPDITFTSAWNRPAKLRDLYAAGVVPDDIVTGLGKGTLPKKEAEMRLRPYLYGEEPVGGVLISETGEKLSVHDAWNRGLLNQETCMSLLEAQAATGRIVDPRRGARYSVEDATKAGILEKQQEAVLSRDERAVYGYTTKTDPKVLSMYEAINKGHIPESHGTRLLEAQLATGGIIDPNVNHRLPLDVAYQRGLLDKRTVDKLDVPENRKTGREIARGFTDPNTGEKLTYLELMERCVKDSDTGMRLLPLYARRTAWEDTAPKIKPSQVTMEGTQTEMAKSSSSSTSSSSTSEAEMEISVVTGEMSTQTADFPSRKKKRKVPRSQKYKPSPSSTIERESSMRSSSMPSSESEKEIVYRYAQQAQGQPRYGPRPWSPPPRAERAASPISERSTQTLVAPKTTTTRKKKIKDGNESQDPIIIRMTDAQVQTANLESTSSSESSSSEDERPVEPKVIHLYEKGIQKSSSSSSESDEERRRIRIRTQRNIAVGLLDQHLVATGTDTDEKDVKMVTSEAHLERKQDLKPISLDIAPEDLYKTETAVKLPPPPRKVTFITSWGKQVDLHDLHDAGIIDSNTKMKLESGQLEPTDEIVVRLITPYITSNRPIGGILLTESGTKISIFEAAKRGLLRRGTAIGLLEAQAATGNIVDPYTGRTMTVEEALKEGFVDVGYEAPLTRAERAVHGYKARNSDEVLSVFEAMNKDIITHSHGIRLLEAQLATGGIIDPKANHRLPLEAAYRRRMLNQHTLNVLNDKSNDSKSFVDPNTQKNMSYQEVVSRCVTDVETGVLLFPLESQERGRGPKTAANVRSSTSLEVVSPARSKSRERREAYSLPRTSASESSSDERRIRRKKIREIKTSSASIELIKTPVMSGDDDDAFNVKRSRVEKKPDSSDEERQRKIREMSLMLEKDFEVEKREVTTKTVTLESTQKFAPVEFGVKVKETEEEKKSISSSSGEEKMVAQATKDYDAEKREMSMKTVTVESTQKFAPVEFDVEVEEAKEEQTKSITSSGSGGGEKMEVQTTKDVIVDESKDSLSSMTTTTTIITTTETFKSRLKRKRSSKDIKFKSGWNRQATLQDLFASGVVSEETVKELEEGTIEEKDVEANIHQYLVGAEPIAGILLSDSGEKISIYAAWRKGLIRRGTSISLLEAQAATGRILDPKTGGRYSVQEASKEGLIDRQFETVLSRAERAVYGFTTRLSPQVFSLFEAMKRGIVVEKHGIRLLEAQIATGGIIDPKANHRLPVDVAYERGLFDQRMNDILEDPGDDTRGFFDPNTEENLTYLELMERCVTDSDTGMRLLPLRTHRTASTAKRSKVMFQSRTGRQVTLHDLVLARRVDESTAKKVEEGKVPQEEIDRMVAKLRVFVDGTMPIAGVINTDSGERMSIYEAAKSGLIRRGTAFELLEAQACCGKVIDVQTGRVVTIETAIRSGIIDREFKDVVERAHRAVTGYREPFKRELLSLCEAMNRHIVVRRHGIRLLEAQIATGGIFDIKSPVRITPQVALKRALVDAKLADDLENKTTQSYFDPVTGENLNYSELMGRCVTDKDSGLLYLMVEGGTVTGYVRPFEPEHASKIRSQSESPARLTTEEVTTTRSSSSSRLSTSKTSETTKKKSRKSKSSKDTSISTSSTGTESGEGSPPLSPSILSRRVIIVDPDTNEEIDVNEALKRKLIDKDTARQLLAQQGDYEESF